MTLAFDLVALRRMQAPRKIVVDARQWARHVGIVGKNPDAATAFATRHLIRRDFPRHPHDRETSLRVARSRFETDRYVFIGLEGDRTLTEGTGWEFLPVETAAERAEWPLEEATHSDQTLRARLRKLF